MSAEIRVRKERMTSSHFMTSATAVNHFEKFRDLHENKEVSLMIRIHFL
jgi:hypothetical protein